MEHSAPAQVNSTAKTFYTVSFNFSFFTGLEMRRSSLVGEPSVFKGAESPNPRVGARVLGRNVLLIICLPLSSLSRRSSSRL